MTTNKLTIVTFINRDHHGRDCMVVRCISTDSINALHHLCCELDFFAHGEVYLIQPYVLKFISDL